MQLDDFVLYLDENLHNCKPILNALEEKNIRFERHGTYFEPGTADEVWLRYVGERAWAVLTKDKRNRFNQWERTAVLTMRIREFYFGSGNFSGAEMAETLKKALPKMQQICSEQKPPFVANISRGGHVTVLFDEHGSTHLRRQARKRK